MANGVVTLDALETMISAFDTYVSDAADCINKMQNDMNTCADNMSNDELSAKAIIHVNACLQKYRQLLQRAEQTRELLKKERDYLEYMGEGMNE